MSRKKDSDNTAPWKNKYQFRNWAYFSWGTQIKKISYDGLEQILNFSHWKIFNIFLLFYLLHLWHIWFPHTMGMKYFLHILTNLICLSLNKPVAYLSLVLEDAVYPFQSHLLTTSLQTLKKCHLLDEKLYEKMIMHLFTKKNILACPKRKQQFSRLCLRCFHVSAHS